ncbi:hypothetical protein TrVE_jg12152, partial [Triparma verrucosa]
MSLFLVLWLTTTCWFVSQFPGTANVVDQPTTATAKALGSFRSFSGSESKKIHPHSYTICNGLSNQLLAHAGNIAYAITYELPILVPNAFIVNGVQTVPKKGGTSLEDVTPSSSEYVKLSDIFDTDSLVTFIESFGITATLVPYEENTHGTLDCSWAKFVSIASPTIATEVLSHFRPSIFVQKVVDYVQRDLSEDDTVCVHHRNGEDWRTHCENWESISDGVWRHNCMNEPSHDLAIDIKNRLLPNDFLPTIFYIGDDNPPADLERAGLTVTTRSQIMTDANDFDLLGHDSFDNLSTPDNFVSLPGQKLREILSYRGGPCLPGFRDICAIVDFLVCSSLKNFIGNSVSTFSALQIAQRFGEATWYNSRSIPLANVLKAYAMPIAYTYTEESAETGKFMLMTSILSAKLHNPNCPIHILYHGSSDTTFQAWLEENSVIVHFHTPTWIPLIMSMFNHGDIKKSHLFHHVGNYIGTWQRIDIPLYIKAEYVLLIDCDTVVSAPFTHTDFGLEMTKSISFSAEGNEDLDEPWNAGVALLNLPYLRE